ncbi:transposable element Tc1 transposase [Trichonephila clavipes]|uniref:Transposable element Tc1 transposase n=1 Tax=Trichonephila clavipes TaxID=2585209 RepID=A0A8X6V839_TRICX|nr:transposable element Tc1 transposase [Trichonephila clavipes]
MSSRHPIDDFKVRIIGKIEEGRKITDVARCSTSLTALFHGCGSHLKLLECVVDDTEEGRVRNDACRRQIYRPISKMEQAHHSSADGKSVSCCLRKADLPKNCCQTLSSDCRRQLIWRESGTAYRPENIQEKDRYPTCSIMVWAGIMINGRTRLHVVANRTMTGNNDTLKVLLPHDCLDSEGIQRLVWSARSPDLNPLENVWDAFGRQVAGRNYPPTKKNTLIRALTEEWDKLPQQLLEMLCKVWYDVWNVASHSTVDISRSDTFL